MRPASSPTYAGISPISRAGFPAHVPLVSLCRRQSQTSKQSSPPTPRRAVAACRWRGRPRPRGLRRSCARSCATASASLRCARCARQRRLLFVVCLLCSSYLFFFCANEDAPGGVNERADGAAQVRAVGKGNSWNSNFFCAAGDIWSAAAPQVHYYAASLRFD